MSVISLAYSEDEAHVSDLRILGRKCPCGGKDRWSQVLLPLARLPVVTTDSSNINWHLLHARSWAGTGVTEGRTFPELPA